LLLSFASEAYALKCVVYFSPTGDDSNSGDTIGTPYKILFKGRQNVDYGGTRYLRVRKKY
jgi:hypothetical protein